LRLREERALEKTTEEASIDFHLKRKEDDALGGPVSLEAGKGPGGAYWVAESRREGVGRKQIQIRILRVSKTETIKRRTKRRAGG